MKKWVALIVVIISIFTLVSYLIPTRINIHETTTIPVNTNAFTRQILEVRKWKWWPGVEPNNKNFVPRFHYNSNTYTVTEKKLTSIVIQVSNGKDSIKTELVFIPLRADTVQLDWLAVKETGQNLFIRLQKSSWIKEVRHDLKRILEKMRSFYSNEDNIYGFHIENTQVVDSNFIFTSLESKNYPTTNLVYQIVSRLRRYVQANRGQSTGYPMLNVLKANDSSYVTKVAIPVDIQLKDSGDIHYRWMLKGGNILVGEIRGGPYKIEKAFSEMQNYIQDHQRNSPAIPYQSLTTDRTLEPDTNKWVTKLYWPVM